MALIYKSKGKAAEYSDYWDAYTLNPYNGCTFGCTYCSVPASLRMSKEDYHSEAAIKKDYLKRLYKELPKFEGESIFMSFIGDIFQPREFELEIVYETLQMMLELNIRPVLLTKGKILNPKYWDLMKEFKELWFGHTITALYDREAESNCATIATRTQQLAHADTLGLKTWISIEPGINAREAAQIIEEIPADHYKIGRLKGKISNNEIEDWKYLVKNIHRKYPGKDIYLKESITSL